MKLLRIGQLQQQLDFVLRFNELPLRVICRPVRIPYLRANVAQVIIILARYADVFALEYLVDADPRKSLLGRIPSPTPTVTPLQQIETWLCVIYGNGNRCNSLVVPKSSERMM